MVNAVPVDLTTWPRASHWTYYRQFVKAAISMTHRVDVKPLVDYCHREGKSFSSVFLFVLSKTVNSLECMRMTADENGNPAVWDVVHPNYTIFHEDDHTFSDVWMEYDPDADTFLANFHEILAQYGEKHGIKVRDGQPPNFFCVSALPWISYDSFHSYTAGDRPPMLFPVITYGKYEPDGNKLSMPVSITISHAAMDGYHVARFYELLQENICSVS